MHDYAKPIPALQKLPAMEIPDEELVGYRPFQQVSCKQSR